MIDQDLAQRINDQIKMQEALRESYENLSPNVRLEVKKHFGNSLVHVAFHLKSTSRMRKAAIPLILKLLQSSAPFVGDAQLKVGSRLTNVVRKITVRGGVSDGPWFNVEAAGSFADPILDRLRQKFARRYKTSVPVELLAYYELQPLPLEWVWGQLDAFIKAHLAGSLFQRIWVYDHSNKEIKYVYPTMDTQ